MNSQGRQLKQSKPDQIIRAANIKQTAQYSRFRNFPANYGACGRPAGCVRGRRSISRRRTRMRSEAAFVIWRVGRMVPWKTWLRQHVLITFLLFLIKASALILAGQRVPDPNNNRPVVSSHGCRAALSFRLLSPSWGRVAALPVPGMWAGNDVAAASCPRSRSKSQLWELRTRFILVN